MDFNVILYWMQFISDLFQYLVNYWKWGEHHDI